jgi:hypothetical protein
VIRRNANLAVIKRQGDKLRLLLQSGLLGGDDDAEKRFSHRGIRVRGSGFRKGQTNVI